MWMFSNEHTLQNFMREKAEGQFHDKYEKALEKVRSEFGRTYSLIIGGNEVTTVDTMVHNSPIDSRIVLGYLPIGSISHVRKAIVTAKKAFERWGVIDYRERTRICRVTADLIADRKFELAAWVSFENGKNRYEAVADIDEAIDFLRYYSEELEENKGFEKIMKRAEQRCG